MKGRHRAQALATEPAWGSARTFIAQGEGGALSSLEPRWTHPGRMLLSASSLRGSPGRSSLCSGPLTQKCLN